MIEKLRVDDAVEASPIHLFGGMWGTIATGLFSNKKGVFYGASGCGTFFGYQILGLVCMFLWTTFFSILFFFSMKKLNLLRIEKEIEIIGLDIAELGGMTDEVYQRIKIEYGRNLLATPEINRQL